MNWDISIGHGRRVYGRVLQSIGRRLDDVQMIVEGQRAESRGRLQARYGVLKHQVQWGAQLIRLPLAKAADRGERR